MTKEKTILEWLEELPDGYRELALKNYGPEFCDTAVNIIDLSHAVMWGFSWEDTPEGQVFWDAVWGCAIGKGELPPLPEGGNMNKERLGTRNKIGKLILLLQKDRNEDVVWGGAIVKGELPPVPEVGKMSKESLVTRDEIGKLILIRLKGRIEEVVVRSVSPNGKFMKVNIGHESVWLDIGNYPICDILPEARWVRDLCGLPEGE